MGKRSRKRSTGSAGARATGGAGTKTAWKAEPAGAPAKRKAAPAPAPPKATAAASAAHARQVSRKARRDEAPPAPWDPFPLVELSIFVGIVLIVVAFVVGGDATLPLLAIGFGLVAVSAIELAVREHFAGYRSHTTLLAGSSMFVTVVPTYLVTGSGSGAQQAILVVGGLTFAVAFWLLRGVFARRAGGLGFRA